MVIHKIAVTILYCSITSELIANILELETGLKQHVPFTKCPKYYTRT